MSSLPVDMDLESTSHSDSPTPTFSQEMDVDHEQHSDIASDTSSGLSSLAGSCPPTPESFREENLDHPRHLDTSKWLSHDEQNLWRFGHWRDENDTPSVTSANSAAMQSIEDRDPPVPQLGSSVFPWYTPPVRARRLFKYPASWRFVPVARRGPGNHGSETYIMFDRKRNSFCHGKTFVDHTNQNLYEGAWWADWHHPHIIEHVGWQGCFHPRYCWDKNPDSDEVGCYSHPSSPHSRMRMTELCELGPLTDEIRRTLTGKQVLEVVRQAASALRFIHRHRGVHTDVKPSKILIRSLSPVNIALDLSTSMHIYEHWEGNGIPGRLGTPGWQSRMTEQCGQTYTAWDDLWSLGSLILWLVAKPYRKLQDWNWQAQLYYTMELGRLNPEDRLVRLVMVYLINTRPGSRHLKILEAKDVQRMVTEMLEDGVYGDEKIILNDDVESFSEHHEYGSYQVIRE